MYSICRHSFSSAGAIKVIPGSSFLHADCCAPTDSPVFQRAKGAIRSGRKGWDILCESDKVRQAFTDGRTQRSCLHPYRRMDPVREFRVFVKGREIAAMSQLRLDRYQPKLESRKGHIWRKAKTLIDDVADYLPLDNIVVDIYLTSTGAYMIIDMNPWGEPTDPLLFRTWERDWDQETGLLLVPKPTKLGGEVEVSP